MNKPNLLQIVHSVLAAAFGVQSEKNRERDFQYGSPTVFIIAGIIGTILFILLVRLVVSFAID